MENQTQQVEAIALVLTKGKLDYNDAGQAEVKLQLMLGHKAMLLTDTHPYAKKEILQAVATDHLAWQASALSPAEQITFRATLVTDSHRAHLQLTTIEPLSATGNAALLLP